MSMIWISPEGVPAGKVAFATALPDNFPMREGYTISWGEQYFVKGLEAGVIRHKKAIINITSVGGSFMVRVESQDKQSFNEAVEKVILLTGGKISTFEIAPTTNQSFIGGVRNDFLRLKEYVNNKFSVVRQRIGMKIL